MRGVWLIADFSGHKPSYQHYKHPPKPTSPVLVKKTPWDILGVTPQTDREAIKQAYRRLARLYHPDVNRSRDAHEKMQVLNEAYAAIVDENEEAD
ncbi:MAG: J domain-containing protein [Anaerolineae bacterium]|nr:J domain-containing protein [Anaerolineae bacterium]